MAIHVTLAAGQCARARAQCREESGARPVHAQPAGSGGPAAPPPLSPLQPPQAPSPGVPPRQHEAPPGRAEPGSPARRAPGRSPGPPSQQQVAPAGQEARAAAGRVQGRYPQRAAPAPSPLLAAAEHSEHCDREACPRAASLATRAHRHLHRVVLPAELLEADSVAATRRSAV